MGVKVEAFIRLICCVIPLNGPPPTPTLPSVFLFACLSFSLSLFLSFSLSLFLSASVAPVGGWYRQICYRLPVCGWRKMLCCFVFDHMASGCDDLFPSEMGRILFGHFPLRISLSRSFSYLSFSSISYFSNSFLILF